MGNVISTKRVSLLAVIAAGLTAVIMATTLNLATFTPAAYASKTNSRTVQVAKLPDNVLSFIGFVASANTNSKNCKLNNTRIARAQIDNFSDDSIITIYLKKTGTTKLTYFYKGEKHIVKIVVKKFVNPFKSFKLDAKECKKYFAGNSLYLNETTGSSGCRYGVSNQTFTCAGKKIKISAISGWKVNKIYYLSNGKKVSIKNGNKVPKEANGPTVEMKNKKTGFIESFWLL